MLLLGMGVDREFEVPNCLDPGPVLMVGLVLTWPCTRSRRTDAEL